MANIRVSCLGEEPTVKTVIGIPVVKNGHPTMLKLRAEKGSRESRESGNSLDNMEVEDYGYWNEDK